jgi:hypothetical protein
MLQISIVELYWMRAVCTDLFARLIISGDQQSSMTSVSCKPGMFVQKSRLNFVCNSSREFNTIPLVLSGMKHAWVDSNLWLARPSVALSQGHHVYWNAG